MTPRNRRTPGTADVPSQADTPGVALAPAGVAPPTAVTAAQVAAEVGQADVYRGRAHAPATLRAYASDWAHFAAYCAARGASPLPADPLVVRTYLAVCADQLGRKVSTIRRRLAAIAHMHKAAGAPLDTRDAALQATWRGIRRTHGVKQDAKAPAVTEEVKAMVDRLPPTLGGLRDRALLLVGFAGAFRRAELCALDVGDLEWEPDGVRLVVRQSKTDQEGAGMVKGIPYAPHPEHCPARALRAWLDHADIEAGPVFRPVSRTGTVAARRLTAQWVALTVKRALTPVARAQAARAWDRRSPTQRARDDQAVWVAAYVARLTRRYAGHSLRAGFVTSAAAAGARVDEIMDQTGQKDVKTVMRYVRNARAVRASAAAKLGL